MKRELVLGSGRDLGTIGLVAGLCGLYAGVLVSASAVLATLGNNPGNLGFTLQIASLVFNLIAIYVAAVVITNAVDTVLAGRLRQLALLRLLGARSADLRRVVMRSTGLIGLLAALVGAVVGVVITAVTRVVLVGRGTIPSHDYPLTSSFLVVPVAVIAIVALVCGWRGSRRVLTVTPAEAMTGVSAPPPASLRESRLRKAFALLVMAAGALLLLGAAWTGEHYAGYGFLLAFFGATTFTTGLLIGARYVVPWLVSAAGRALGETPASRIARRNAVLDPQRTTRSTMGLVIGVAIVTTIASGMGALQQAVDGWTQLTPTDRVLAHQLLSMIASIMTGIVVVSCVISVIGFISTMSLTVIQRRREIGLLRAVGFTTTQVRSMITRESAALAGTAVLFGLILGVVFGSLGAQSLVGFQTNGFVWGTPWAFLATVGTVGVLLVLVSALPPARRATSVPVVAALRFDG